MVPIRDWPAAGKFSPVSSRLLERGDRSWITQTADEDSHSQRAFYGESLFIHHLLKEMRATIDKSGFISGGRAEEIYTSMMDAETANRIANKGGMGLADMLLHQLGNHAAEIKTEESD